MEKIDRDGWRHGAWDDEPDIAEWQYAGLHCLIQRSQATGSLCGYVGLDSAHPLYGCGYDDGRVDMLDIHGGITFAGSREDATAAPGMWWIGFDCGHAFDDMPAIRIKTGEYRLLDWVRLETETLAEKLAAMAANLAPA